MLAVSFFGKGKEQTESLRLSGETVRCKVFRFPDTRLMVIASSEGDGRTGKAVLHSNELRDRTKGMTEYMEVGNSFRLQSQLENIIVAGIEEERVLKLRIGELNTAHDYLMHCGPLKEGEPKEIVELLKLIENHFSPPKRNAEKLAAGRNVRKGLDYRSSKAKIPVGPVTAITVRAARMRVENRIRQIVRIRQAIRPKLELSKAFNREAEKLFKALKDEGNIRSPEFQRLLGELDQMRLQPFEAAARKIEASYASFRYADASELDTRVAIRRELHAVLLVCVVERQVIRRLSYITHHSLPDAEVKKLRLEVINKIKRIAKRVNECDSFSKDARLIGASRLEHARSMLDQEDLFDTPNKRLDSAQRILKELAAILPV